MYKDQTGSSALGILFTTLGTGAALLLTYNITRYINAQAAVEQAVIKVERCLTPTDPECVTYEASPSESQRKHWYGFNNSGDASTMDIFATKFAYSAQMFSKSYGANYNTYDIRLVTPIAEWTALDIPQKKFTLPLNPWKDIYGTLRVPLEEVADKYFRPTWEPVFPVRFTQDTFRDPASWLSYEQASGNTNPYFEAAPSNVSLPGEGFQTFKTGRILIPKLEETNGLACKTSAGAECSSAEAAGASFVPDEWASHARLAVKALAQASPKSSSGSLRWDQGNFGPKAGLYINIYSETGALTSTYCLGGRDNTTVSSPSWVNLWLRGPAGANGGASATRCTENQNDFDNLLIPRGSSFEIIGYLTPSNVHLNVVTFYYTYDNYELYEKISQLGEATCNNVRLSSKENRPLCEEIVPGAQCSNSNGNNSSPQTRIKKESSACHSSSYASYWRQTSETPRCTKTDVHSFRLDGEPSIYETRYSMCIPSWTPPLSNVQPLKSGRIACGPWDVAELNKYTKVEGQTPASCPLAKNTTESFACKNEIVYGTSFSVERCDGFSSTYASLIDSLSSLSNEAPVKGSSFKTEPTVSLHKTVNDHWEFSWTNLDESGVIAPQGSYRRYTHSLPSSALVTQFKKVTSPAYTKPAPKDFLISILEHSGHSASERGWGDYQTYPEKYLAITSTPETSHSFNDIYPFKEPVYEIYWGQNGLQNGFDFNLDCTPDSLCQGDFTAFNSVDEMLRSFAADVTSEAEDPSFVFTSSATPVSIERIATVTTEEAAQNSLGLEECTPTKTVCRSSDLSAAQLVDLGISEAMPAACSNNILSNCYSVLEGELGEEAPALVSIDPEKAKRAGLGELQRMFNNVSLQGVCDGNLPGCAQIDIATDDTRALVKVSMDVPIEFPLNTFLGKNTLRVESTKDQIFETAMVGR